MTSLSIIAGAAAAFPPIGDAVLARSATMSAVDLDELTDRVVQGPWPDRVAAIRSVPAEFAGKEHAQVYAEVGRAFYAEKLAPHFHLIPWPEKFLDRRGF